MAVFPAAVNPAAVFPAAGRDPEDHKDQPDQQALRGQWNPGDSPVRQGHGGLRDLWDFQDLKA